MTIYQAVCYWQTSTRSFCSVFRGSFESCLKFASQSYIGYSPRWEIFLGELISSDIFYPRLCVARSSVFKV